MNQSELQEVSSMFNIFNYDTICSWGNLIRFGLAVSHALMPSPAPNQEEQCWWTFQVSKKLLLFEIFVLAICDISALTEQQASAEKVVFYQKFKTLSIFAVSYLQPTRNVTGQKEPEVKSCRCYTCCSEIFFLGKIRKYVLCRSIFWQDHLWLRTLTFFSLYLWSAFLI